MVTTINYVDRQVLGILAPTLQREMSWSEAQYGDVGGGSDPAEDFVGVRDPGRVAGSHDRDAHL